MNVRLLIVPSTQGDNFLLGEDVWNTTNLPEDAPWPIKELCGLLQEADRQGIPWDTIAALRAHTGAWVKIAVWKIVKQIDLWPPKVDNDWYVCLPPDWQVHAGTIVDSADDKASFEQLDMMPRQGLSRFG
ncbi:hypothetical protein FS749_014430 [Ceratobasidium sp. UAMH 11750]|nr:hypothetical protein FS749_014430 [Ceratobasidium sp. UAMH 11750]